jgi:hypothetical protein
MQTQGKQTATIAADFTPKFNPRHRKETPCFLEVREVITFDQAATDPLDRVHVPVQLRLYGTGRTNSACLWINHNGTHRAASGIAGGCGYHRPSAAAGAAIAHAGIKLSQDIDGVGDNAIDEALCAIAEALGLTTYGITRTHA